MILQVPSFRPPVGVFLALSFSCGICAIKCMFEHVHVSNFQSFVLHLKALVTAKPKGSMGGCPARFMPKSEGSKPAAAEPLPYVSPDSLRGRDQAIFEFASALKPQ